MANTTWSTTDKAAGITLRNVNKTATNSNNAVSGVRAADSQLNGKFYWEYTCTVSAGTNGVGVAGLVASLLVNVNSVTPSCVVRTSDGTIFVNTTSAGALGAIGAGAVVCCAVDASARLAWFRLGAAGLWNNSGTANPATGAGGFSISLGIGIALCPYAVVINTNDTVTANFGDSAFAGAVPSGFTSGFPAGTSISTNEIVTQTGVEEWGSGVPAMQATQVGVEEWGSSLNPAAVTQVSAEHWAAASPDAAVTQALVEHWGTVSTISTQAVVTQVAVEHWITEAAVSTARKRRVVCVSG
jgi:hypothetical protein